MDSETLQKLVSKLIDNTKSGKLQWTNTSGEMQFMAQFPKSAITVDYYKAGGTVPEYDLMIYNDKGANIDRVVHNTEAPNTYGAENEDNPILAVLYELVKKQFYQIDQTFDDIFDSLD